MAKAKKISTLTPEERLQQALVPDWEQPYKVPENWVWVWLTEGFAECLDQYRKPINATERASRTGNVPYYGATGQVGWIDDYLTNEPLILIGEDGAPFFDFIKNKAYLIEGKAWVNNHAHILKSFYGEKSNLFLMHYLNAFNYKGYVNGTTRLKLTQASLKTLPIPLPPLAEQHRIVSRIESLFEKLDQARELIQTALDSFETRKAAILHKAFTGELTAKWRTENGVGIESWGEKTINDICISLQYGTSKKSVNSGSVVVIRMGNLQNGEIIWDDLAYSNDMDDIKKYLLHPDDVLFNRTNSPALVGKTSIYRGDYPAIFAGYLIRLNYKKEIVNGIFLNYALNSTNAKDYCSRVKTDGVNQSNINAKKIGAYSFHLPTLREQQEIVRILDSLLEKEQRAKSTLEPLLNQIDLMKKSILARAFRGKLGTNDPTEPNAHELLKEILAD